MKKIIRKLNRALRRVKTLISFYLNTKNTNEIIYISATNKNHDDQINCFLKKIKENPIYFAPQIARVDASIRRYKFKYGISFNNGVIESLFIVQSNGIISGPISTNEDFHLRICNTINLLFPMFTGKKNTGSFFNGMPNIDATLVLSLNQEVVDNLRIRKGKGVRKDIKTAEENNVQIVFNDFSLLKAFWKLHKDHLGDKAYSFDVLKRLTHELPNLYSFAAAIDSTGSLLSGAVFVTYGNRSMFWLSATTERGKETYSQALCILETIKRCYNKGSLIFDFGGVGYPKLNSWDNFKKNFGSEYEIKYKK